MEIKSLKYPKFFKAFLFGTVKKTSKYRVHLNLIYASSIKSCAEIDVDDARVERSINMEGWKLRPRGSGLNITMARAIYKD